jgi:prepilin-type N-terminal cleavage/methylation domain-containing protein
MSRVNHRNHGFTIVELLVVIVVIGILAAITIVSYTGISQKAVVSSLQSDLANAAKGLKMYQIENGQFPQDINYSTGCPTLLGQNYCLKSSSNNKYESYYSDNSTTTQTFYLQLRNGSVCKWIMGRIGTALDGKYVYSQNLSATTWGPISSSCGPPQCGQNLDEIYPAEFAFVSDNSVNFSLYPARNACKAVKGRLPYLNEAIELYGGQVYYGNNFGEGQEQVMFWSATDTGSEPTIARYFDTARSMYDYMDKDIELRVRCVR